jgi:hypothetical protein
MLNSELTLELAQQWAERLLAEHGGESNAMIRAAFRTAYGREATDADVVRSAGFLGGEAGEPAIEKVADFCHTLFNSNEFILVD